ncbi:MAG TPA: IS5 family transposase [Candidatus Saccharimonadales bacterium]|nr:IS5 family transposase [Candidatus Saccharimonadales bacterium]
MRKKNTKPYYRIRNWRQYNSALVQRGSLTLWFDQSAMDAWLNTQPSGRRGKSRLYADAAILCALTIRQVFHLPLRATQGLIGSLVQLLELGLPVMDYSTLCRRARRLEVKLSAQPVNRIKHLVFDATGLKVYGEGEWKVRLYDAEKRRTWRKLHISLDASTHQIITALVTDKDVVDPRCLPGQLKQVESRVERVYGDGAYDARICYRAIDQCRARAIIPPRRGSTLWKDDYLKGRNSNLRAIRKLGLKKWKKKVGYHTRSLVETAFFRLKRIFSDKLCSQRDETQITEVMIRCRALNRMTSLGMPESSVV